MKHDPGLFDPIWFDPDWASGYEYAADGARIGLITLPGPAVGMPQIGDNLFDLWLYDDLVGDYADSGIDLVGGITFEVGLLDPSGLERFQIRGIDASAMLDSDDPTAFPTGLSTIEPGILRLTQRALLSEPPTHLAAARPWSAGVRAPAPTREKHSSLGDNKLSH
ncbi:MAG: hypothetical protein N838_06755 [Thiohalocapsa sp. PB-PSB1]|nr:MAG: hypothetical protein N838_01780 [Thiohalocapsa sp. PB-PSB1]QQO53109.1 MAG: hypothetical protein N838_06755 [Thiohalocapsa sp. PB-PSB1]HCS90556.1 hypothetical protein [Chromatiaceae bacterium]